EGCAEERGLGGGRPGHPRAHARTWDLSHATRARNWIVTNDYPSYRRADQEAHQVHAGSDICGARLALRPPHQYSPRRAAEEFAGRIAAGAALRESATGRGRP